MEAKALTALTPGPGNWRVVDDLFFLKETFHLPVSFQSIRVASLAAKLRVYWQEALSTTRWNAHVRVKEMQSWIGSAPFGRRFILWRDWFNDSFVKHLADADTEARGYGISVESVHEDLIHLAGTQRRRSKQEVENIAKRKLQSTLYSKLLTCRGQYRDQQARIRHKMDKWTTSLLPARLADKVAAVTRRLHTLVPPPVHAAAYRTSFNGWRTGRYFRTCKVGLAADRLAVCLDARGPHKTL